MAENNSVDERRSYVRLDVASRILKTDEATQIFWVELSPDPRRYREVVHDGMKYYQDKYLAEEFSEDLWLQSVPKLQGLPISHLPRHIDDSVAYSAKRRDAIETELSTGEHVLPEKTLKPQEPLRTTPQVRNMTFLSIDIVGSTVLGAQDRDAYDKCFDIFFREMATVAAQFSGEIPDAAEKPHYLNADRLKIKSLPGWNFGIKRYVKPIEDLVPLFDKVCETKEWLGADGSVAFVR